MKYFIVLFLIISCNAQKAVREDSKLNSSKNNVGLELVLSDNYSGLSKPEIQIIKEPSALLDFYSQINKTRKPGFAVPNIDFKNEIVVIYCAGEQLNDGFAKVEIVSENSTQIIFKIVASESIKNNQATKSPFSVYKLKMTEKELSFIKT